MTNEELTHIEQKWEFESFARKQNIAWNKHSLMSFYEIICPGILKHSTRKITFEQMGITYENTNEND